MNDPNDPQPPQQPLSPLFPKDQLDILKFLREESEKNREAQRSESEANRKLFLGASAIVAIPLTVLLTLSSLFFYHDINAMKEAMKTEGEAEAKAEIKRMDAQIDKTLEDRFQADNIQKTIQQAAVDATSKQAPALIKEVITPEVRKAVQGQSGTIKNVATQAATEQVKVVLEPFFADVKLQGVIARANSDDAKSFDELLAITTSSSATPSQKELVDRVIANLERHSQEGASFDGDYAECADPSGDKYKALLTSPVTTLRKSAIGDCVFYMSMGQWVPRLPGKSVSAFTVMETIAPMWVQVAFTDPSLSVRAAAITGLNTLFKNGTDVPKNGFDLLDNAKLKTWWTRHEVDQSSIALFAYAHGADDRRGSASRLDEIGLYDEAEHLARVSLRNRSLLEQLRTQMRSYAAAPQLPASALAREMGRDCAGVQKDLAIRLNGFNKQPEQERLDNYGLLELQYLAENCTVGGDALRQIAGYGVSTRSLSSRFAVVMIVNKAKGTSLDPYQSQTLEEQIRGH